MPSRKTIELMRVVGFNVRRLRRARRSSQESLAEQCGLHRTYVGSIERAEKNLTLETLVVLANALDVEPIDLLSSDGQKT